MTKEAKRFVRDEDIDEDSMISAIRRRNKKISEGKYCRGSHCNSHCYHGSKDTLTDDAKKLVGSVEGGAKVLISALRKRRNLELSKCSSHCWGHCKIHND